MSQFVAKSVGCLKKELAILGFNCLSFKLINFAEKGLESVNSLTAMFIILLSHNRQCPQCEGL